MARDMNTDALSIQTVAAAIDHTLLNPDASSEALARLCDEAVAHGFRAVCVYPRHADFVSRRLAGSGIKTAAVVGFPGGLEATDEKVRQAAEALSAGAVELDMVINRVALSERDFMTVYRDIGAVVAVAAPFAVKVILETAALPDDLIVAGAAIGKAAGAAFVKTSTGFGPGGASERAVALLRATVGPGMGVKASGGIKTLAQARAMLAAGADVLGCSASVSIVSGR